MHMVRQCTAKAVWVWVVTECSNFCPKVCASGVFSPCRSCIDASLSVRGHYVVVCGVLLHHMACGLYLQSPVGCWL